MGKEQQRKGRTLKEIMELLGGIKSVEDVSRVNMALYDPLITEGEAKETKEELPKTVGQESKTTVPNATGLGLFGGVQKGTIEEQGISRATGIIFASQKRKAEEEKRVMAEEEKRERETKRHVREVKEKMKERNRSFLDIDEKYGVSESLRRINLEVLKGEGRVDVFSPHKPEEATEDSNAISPDITWDIMKIDLTWSTISVGGWTHRIRVNLRHDRVEVLTGMPYDAEQQGGDPKKWRSGIVVGEFNFYECIPLRSSEFDEEYQKALATAFENSYVKSKPPPDEWWLRRKFF